MGDDSSCRKSSPENLGLFQIAHRNPGTTGSVDGIWGGTLDVGGGGFISRNRQIVISYISTKEMIADGMMMGMG